MPSSAGDLNAWLQKRAYTCWARESRVHSGVGPHGGNVRVYLNAALDRSLSNPAPNGEHPVGAVAVKELFDGDATTLTGWAVGVKTQESSDGGKGWYWYEVFGTSPSPSDPTEGQGVAVCSTCHATGKDFVLTKYPLR